MVIVYQNDTTTPPSPHTHTAHPHRAYSYPKGGFGHAELVKMMGYKLTRGKMRPLMNLVLSNGPAAVDAAVAATHAVIAKGGSATALRSAADEITGESAAPCPLVSPFILSCFRLRRMGALCSLCTRTHSQTTTYHTSPPTSTARHLLVWALCHP